MVRGRLQTGLVLARNRSTIASSRAAGRMHRREDIYRAAEFLSRRRISHISMDLIAGLAHQTRETWEASVGQLVRILPEHVSVYMLEVDEDSRLGKEALAGGNRYGAAAIPDDDAMADFYDYAAERLASAGYEHYEFPTGIAGPPLAAQLKYWRRRALSRPGRRRSLL